MKKIIATILCLVIILSGCSSKTDTDEATTTSDSAIASNDIMPSFSGLDDKNLLTYMDDLIYSDLVSTLNSNELFVENVNSIYISKEYIEESSYNAQSNIFFGYSLSELDDYFGETKYVFTTDDNGKTVVKEMNILESVDVFDEILKNVAVGAGVIVFTVTVSVITAGVGAPAAVTMICAASASSAVTFAESGAIISGLAAGAVKLYQTQDIGEAIKTTALEGSKGFKWGAISGAVAGGSSKAIGLKIATKSGLSMNEAAAIQQESGYPLDLIKQFKSVDEYNVYKEAGLYTKMVNGKLTLVRDIDLDYVSELPDGEKVTNLMRMKKGNAPIDPETGKAYQLHHINQNKDGTLAILTAEEHHGNSAILNSFGKNSEIDRSAFDKVRKIFWQKYAEMFQG